jgi:peptidoglycan/LPS O-acetylase OafA/YrhL
MPGTLKDLQALRGVACLLVVVYHFAGMENESAWGWHPARSFLRFGFAGVDLFFVLSGFIIMRTQFARLGCREEFRPYFVKRLWRIYPTYWVCFVVTAGLFHWILDYCYFRGYFRHAAYHALLIPLPGSNMVIPQAWTLTYEVMFYMLFGFLFLLPRKRVALVLAGWALAAVVGTLILWQPDKAWLLPLSPYSLEFLLG